MPFRENAAASGKCSSREKMPKASGGDSIVFVVAFREELGLLWRPCRALSRAISVAFVRLRFVHPDNIMPAGFLDEPCDDALADGFPFLERFLAVPGRYQAQGRNFGLIGIIRHGHERADHASRFVLPDFQFDRSNESRHWFPFMFPCRLHRQSRRRIGLRRQHPRHAARHRASSI